MQSLLEAVSRALAVCIISPSELQIEDLTISLTSRQVWRGKQVLLLTKMEFDVLAYLAQRCGQVVSYDELLERVWHCSPGTGSQEQVHAVVFRLRGKIEQDQARPCVLVSVRGVGYRLGGAVSKAGDGLGI